MRITSLKSRLVIPTLLLAMVCTAASETIYVDADANGANDGLNWENAYKYLQDALTATQYGDEIWVTAGTYRPDEGGGKTPGDRLATFQLTNGVAIYAGFPSGGGAWTDRDPNAHETILSGDLSGNDEPNFVNAGENSYHVVTSTGTDANTILDGLTITGGNANGPAGHDKGGGMYNHHYSDLRVTNCKLNANAASGDGGGMYSYYYSGPTVIDCTFSDNAAGGDGGVMHNYYVSSPDVANCTFSGNSAGGDGGAIYDYYYSSPTITNSTFRDNHAGRDAGGIYNDYHSSPTITNSTFCDNRAGRDAGGIYNDYHSSPLVTDCTFSRNWAKYVGAVYNYYSSPVLTNCTFTENYAGGDSGGMYNDQSSPTLASCTFSGNYATQSGAMYNNRSSPILTDCTFSGNFANYGGGMYNNQGSPRAVNCTFTGNWATDHGGGIYNYDSGPALTNCTFTDNSADDDGGAVYNCHGSSPVLTTCAFSGNCAGGDGGALANYDSSPTLANCTLAANRAKYGGGMNNYEYGSPILTNCIFSGNVALHGGGMRNLWYSSPALSNCTLTGNLAVLGGGMYNAGFGTPVLTNCILWRDEPAEIFMFYSIPVITYSTIQGGWWGTGNRNADPCFVVPGYWGDVNDPNISVEPSDPNAVWVIGDYHLLASSPCIDAGDNDGVPPDTTDLDDDSNTTEPTPWDLDGNPRFIDYPNIPSTGNGVPPIVDMGAYEAFVPPLRLAMKLTPQTLNCCSRGDWVKAHFALPEGLVTEDVNTNEPAVAEVNNTEIEIQSNDVNVFVNEGGLVEVEIAFDRSTFSDAAIDANDECVDVTVTGLFTNGRSFYGTATIRIIHRNFRCVADFVSRWLEPDCSEPDWCDGFDLDRDSTINFVDIGLLESCCSEISGE